MTEQEFAQKVKAKYPQYKDMNDAELTQKIVAKYPQYSASIDSVASEDRTLGDQASDVAGGAVYGASSIGRTVQNLLSKGADKLLGTTGFGKATKEGFEQSTGTDLDTTSAKVGEFAGEMATFAIPGGAVAKATKTAPMAARILAEGATAGGIQALQTGKVDEDTAITAIFGGALPPIGKALSVAGKNLTTSLPEWLVTPLLKQAKDAKIKGKDIAPFLLQTGRVGSMDSLISQSDDVIKTLNSKVDDALQKASQEGVTVQVDDIVKQVVDKVNAAGGAIDDFELKTVIDRLAPQARGLLNKPTLTLTEANSLRSSIDRTLGDRGFLRDQLPFNKEVLKDFTNSLRETVKTLGPDDLRSTFDDYAKNIRLRNALLERASSATGVNSVGLFDILTGMGGFAASGGNPIGALAVPVARRVFESAAMKTGSAKALTSLNKLAPILEKLSPAERGLFLETIQSLLEGNQEQVSEEQARTE